MAEHNYELKSGDVDKLGGKVLQVYAVKKGRYIIYESVDRRVVCDAEDETLDAEVNITFMRIAELTTHHKALKRYNSELAYALKIALDGDPDTAAEILDGVYKGMNDCLNRWATHFYQLGALLVLLICLAGLWLFNLLVTNETALRLSYSATASAMSGFASVYIGSSKLSFQPLDGHWNVMVNGASRIFVACIFGVIAYVLIQTDFFLSFLKNTSSPFGYLVGAFAAGFSEKLVPNALTGLEGREDKQLGKPVTEVRGTAVVKEVHSSRRSSKPGVLKASELSVLPDLDKTDDHEK